MDVCMARQPILNRNQKTVGYELLFRDGIKNIFPDINGDTATLRLLTNSFLNIGINRISMGKMTFINFTRGLLINKIPEMFHKKSIIIEVLEDVEADDEVVKACTELVEKGYKLALDDFIYKDSLKPLIALATIIKFDLTASSFKEIETILPILKEYKLKFLMEKVETNEEFSRAKDMGFSYFQGYFFSKPEIIKGKQISSDKVNLLQIISEANKEDCSIEKLEQLLSVNLSITHKMFRYINSAYFKRRQEISTIRHALVFLGLKNIKQFISLVVSVELGQGKPDELVRTSIIRAKFCELIAIETGKDALSLELFLLGLFSLIDALLNTEMTIIMKHLPVSKKLKSALINGKGEFADYLKLILAYEAGDWDLVSKISCKIKISEKKLSQHYLEALGWADAYNL